MQRQGGRIPVSGTCNTDPVFLCHKCCYTIKKHGSSYANSWNELIVNATFEATSHYPLDIPPDQTSLPQPPLALIEVITFLKITYTNRSKKKQRKHALCIKNSTAQSGSAQTPDITILLCKSIQNSLIGSR